MANHLQVVLEYKSGVSALKFTKPEANMFQEDTLMPPHFEFHAPTFQDQAVLP